VPETLLSVAISNLYILYPTVTVTMSLHQNRNTGSSTCVISPAIDLEPLSVPISNPQNAKVAGSHTSLRLSDSNKGVRDDDSPTDLPSPTTQSAVQPEQWNHPRSNLFKTMAAFWSFVVMGSNDAAYGALIPYVSRTCALDQRRLNQNLTNCSCKHTTTSPLWSFLWCSYRRW
jgi:hypothetical protein